jgi:hypothetical protein
MTKEPATVSAAGSIDPGSSSVVIDIDGAIASRVAALSIDGLTLSSLVFCGASILWFAASDSATQAAVDAEALRLYVLTWYALGIARLLWHLLTEVKTHPLDARVFAVWAFRLRNGPRVAVDAAHGLALCAASFYVIDLPIMLRAALAATFLGGAVQLAFTRLPVLAGDWIAHRPRPVQLGGKASAAIGALALVLIAVMIGAVWAFVLTTSHHFHSWTLGELRVAWVAIAVAVVARQTSQRYGEQLLVQKLVTLRNDVVFGHMPPLEARTQARHLLVGGNLNDLIAPEVAIVSATGQRIRALIPVISKFVDVLTAELRQSTDGSVRRSALRDGMGDDFQAMSEMHQKLNSDLARFDATMKKLNRKLVLAQIIFGDASGFALEMNAELERQLLAIKAEVAPFHSAWRQLSEVRSQH